MQRRIAIGVTALVGFLLVNGCNKGEEKPVNIAVSVGDSQSQNGEPKLTPQQVYDAGIAKAFCLLGEKKEEEALTAFQEANSAVATDFAKGEIERLKLQRQRSAAAEKLILDIDAVVQSGRAVEASKLAGDALAQYGDSDYADKLTALKRQADALLAVQSPDASSKQKFLSDAESARTAKNFRAALAAYDQAVAASVDVAAVKADYEGLRDKLTRYDEQRAHAAELRRDAGKLEEAIQALEEAKKAWETPQVVQELQDANYALANRRDRLAVADFEVIGDVGIPLAGRTIAEEILPHFKSHYDLVERSQVGAIMEDLKVDASELHSNEKGRSELCRLAKARYLVVGSVSRLGGIVVNARLVDEQTGLIVQTAKIVVATPEELSSKLPELARILQMTDEQKLAHEQELAKAATVAVATPPAQLPPVPDQPAEGAAPAPAPAPIIMNTPRPPESGQVAAADFRSIPAPAAQAQAVVMVEGAPWRDRAFWVAIEVGDNLYRFGRFAEAMRHYEFALALAPGRPEVLARINNCVPFMPAQVVVSARPRLAVLPFAEIGAPGFVPYGAGFWTAGSIAPYFFPAYDIVDPGAAAWWMARLGLSYRDVLVDPSARLCLARALGVRYLLFGSLVDNLGIDANMQIVDAEFNAVAASATMHAGSPFELKMRLGELAQLALMPPAQQVVYLQQVVVVQQQSAQAQVAISSGKFEIAIGFYEQALVAQPNNVEIRIALFETRRRHHRRQLEIQIVEQQQTNIVVMQQQQQQQQVLVASAQQQASFQINININLVFQQQQQAQVQLVTQARTASQQNNFSLSINFYESVPPAQRTPQITLELASVRARSAQAQQVRLAQQQAAQQALLRQQSQAAAAAVIAAKNAQIQAQQAALQNMQARNSAAYNQLLAQAQQAKASRKFDVEVSSLQTAKTLQPSPQIDQMLSAALHDQALANADKKGPAERQKVERNLATAQAQRQRAEQLASDNQTKHDAAIRDAFKAMNARNYVEGKREFEIAARFKSTKESTDGIRWANDEIARQQQESKEKQKAQAQQQKQDGEFTKLFNDGSQALSAKQYDPAVQKLQAAVNLKPTSVEAQAALAKAKQGHEEQAAQAHKQNAQLAKQTPPGKQTGTNTPTTSKSPGAPSTPSTPSTPSPQFLQAIARARGAIGASQFDAARQAIGEAAKIDPSNPEFHKVTQELADAQKAHAAAAAKAPAVDPAKEKFQAAIAAARQSVAAKQFDAAENHLAQARAINAADPAVSQVQSEISRAKAAAVFQAKEPAKTEPKAGNNAVYDQYIAAARQAFAGRNFDAAGKYAAAALQQKPGDAEAAKIAGDAKTALAPAQPKETAKVEPPKADANQTPFGQYIGAARKEFAQKNYDMASKYAGESLKLRPGDAEAIKIVNDSKQALATAKSDPPKADVAKPDANTTAYNQYLAAAKQTLAQKNYDSAGKYAQEALKYKPGDAEATKIVNDARAAMATVKSDPPKTEAPKPDANTTAFNQYLAAAKQTFAQKNYDSAGKYAQEALKYKPGDAEAAKIVNDARAAMATAKSNPPKTEAPKPDANTTAFNQYLAAAKQTFAQKNFDSAGKYAQEALKYKPGDPEATKIVSDAKAAISTAKSDPPKSDPPKADANVAAYNQYIAAARQAYAKREFDTAAKYAQEALKYKPGDADAAKIANDSKTAGAASKAPANVDQQHSDSAARVASLMQTAAAYEGQNKYTEANNTYRDALKLAPANAEAKKKVDFTTLMMSGIRDLSAGRFPAAAGEFDQALRLYPGDANARHYAQLAKDKKKQ